MGGINPASETPVPVADAVLEMVGLDAQEGTTCALLTPAMKAKLREMRADQVLEVRVDDPTAREDIASWCRLAGHMLLTVIEEPPRTLRCYVRKKPA